MHQESTGARDRAGSSSELAGYGDLASFDPQAPRRSREQDDQDAINLIMGGENFLVGDGTLEFKLRDEDRDLMPEIPPVSRAARAQVPEQTEPDFEPIENGFPDPGDAVARRAVTDALSRLECLAGDLVSEEAAENEDEETTGELTEESADDQLNTGGYGGMGSDLESDAPSPFALPKMPGSFEPYVPPVNEATTREVEKDLPYSTPLRSASIPSETSFNRSRDAIRSFEDESEPAPLARSVKHVPLPVIEAKTDEFAPFELHSDRSEDVESFDTRTAEVPSYARTPEKKSGMPVVESDLDAFLPPAEDAPRAAQTRPVEPEVREPAYSQPRTEIETRDVDTDLLEDAFANRETDLEPPGSEAVEPEAGYQASHAAAPAAAAITKPTIFAKYRNLLLGLALGAVLICYKHFTQPSVEGEPEVTSEGAPAQAAPIEKAIPLETVLETPATAPKVNASAGIDPALEEKVAELAEQMAAIQAERNKLREENTALKKKTAQATKPKKVVTVKPADVKAESAPAPVRKPVQNIQYLGTFHDGDRLVAEVLVDGNLARVKRGDSVVGNRRVDAVGDMSVTIDDVVYSP